MPLDSQGDFFALGGNLGACDSESVRFESGFNGVGELDIYLSDRNAPTYNVWGDETGYESQMATISREDALDFHAWLTEQLYES